MDCVVPWSLAPPSAEIVNQKQPCWRVSNSSFFSLFSLFPRVLRVYSSGKDKSGIYNLLVAIEDIHLTISHHFGLDSGTINLPHGMSQASNLSSFCDGLKYLWPMQNRVLIAVLSVTRLGRKLVMCSYISLPGTPQRMEKRNSWKTSISRESSLIINTSFILFLSAKEMKELLQCRDPS